VLKALAAVPVLAGSLTIWSGDVAQAGSHPYDNQPAGSESPPELAYETLIGVL
jgi:hypothetical protein